MVNRFIIYIRSSYIYLYIYIYIYTHTSENIYVFICIYRERYLYIHIYMYTNMYIFTYIPARIPSFPACCKPQGARVMLCRRVRQFNLQRCVYQSCYLPREFVILPTYWCLLWCMWFRSPLFLCWRMIQSPPCTYLQTHLCITVTSILDNPVDRRRQNVDNM